MTRYKNTIGWQVCLWVGGLLIATSVWAQEPSLEERVQRLEEAVQPSDKTFRAYWDHGLRLQTMDEEIKLRIGGLIQNDWNFSFLSDDLQDAFGDPEDRIFFRRARLDFRGTLYTFVRFKASYDFSGGDVDFNDVYIRFTPIPYVGNFFVGKFKTPFGLEEQTSSRFITLQERSLTDALVPGREIGFMFRDNVFGHRMTWALAGTREPDNSSTLATKGADNDWNATARVTGLPWFAGNRLVHLGLAYAFRNFVDDEARFRARPEARLNVEDDGDVRSVRFVDTKTFDAKRGHLLGVESALVHGPLSLQGEFMLVFGLDAADSRPDEVEADDIEDARFYAFYFVVSYFVTGEHRPYDINQAEFDRPIPHDNFLQGGYGAWEVALRVSGIDLDDAEDINGEEAGGRELNLTFGLNWYPNPNVRVTLNYIYGIVDDRVVDDIDLDNERFSIFMMRFQVDF